MARVWYSNELAYPCICISVREKRTNAALTACSSLSQERYGNELVLLDGRRTSSLSCLQRLMTVCGARTLLYNRMYEPWCLQRDKEVERAVTGEGHMQCTDVPLKSFTLQGKGGRDT